MKVVRTCLCRALNARSSVSMQLVQSTYSSQSQQLHREERLRVASRNQAHVRASHIHRISHTLITEIALPSTIDVEKFVEVNFNRTCQALRVTNMWLLKARSFEINAMQTAMESAQYVNNHALRWKIIDLYC